MLCLSALGLSGLLQLFLLHLVLTTMLRMRLHRVVVLTVPTFCHLHHGIFVISPLDLYLPFRVPTTCYICFVQYRIKFTYPFQWGTPIFRASHVFGMMGAALVSTAEV
ncbi:hypothetical protein CsSME_00013780 [Camellia sinensis var. sinensis]